MSSANFKPKRSAAASRGFLAIARLSCSSRNLKKKLTRGTERPRTGNIDMQTGYNYISGTLTDSVKFQRQIRDFQFQWHLSYCRIYSLSTSGLDGHIAISCYLSMVNLAFICGHFFEFGVVDNFVYRARITVILTSISFGCLSHSVTMTVF